MGLLYVVGLGPGDPKYMTQEAIYALKDSDIIAGYSVYVKLAQEVCPDKPTIATGMRHEVERCRAALSEASSGSKVAMVCSGDSGVFGMSGLIYELACEYQDVEIKVISGVTAALSGSSVLGAPLTHDFAVISLSDQLTEWEKIEKRLICAGEADFCIALYNPMSNHRPEHLKRACKILLRYRQPNNVCGYVANIGRDGQESAICTLEELANKKLDMFTTVFIGNSQTRVIDNKMVTPRGYQAKEDGPRIIANSIKHK